MALFRQNRTLWILFYVFLALAVIAGGYLAMLSAQGVPEKVTNQGSEEIREATILEGTYICLPRNDNAKAKECTPGIKAGDDYYALDLATILEGGATTNFSNGTKILAAGDITPIEAISSDQWKVYSIRGIMKVEEVAKQ